MNMEKIQITAESDADARKRMENIRKQINESLSELNGSQGASGESGVVVTASKPAKIAPSDPKVAKTPMLVPADWLGIAGMLIIAVAVGRINLNWGMIVLGAEMIAIAYIASK